jgi:hypothetical protein
MNKYNQNSIICVNAVISNPYCSVNVEGYNSLYGFNKGNIYHLAFTHQRFKWALRNVPSPTTSTAMSRRNMFTIPQVRYNTLRIMELAMGFVRTLVLHGSQPHRPEELVQTFIEVLLPYLFDEFPSLADPNMRQKLHNELLEGGARSEFYRSWLDGLNMEHATFSFETESPLLAIVNQPNFQRPLLEIPVSEADEGLSLRSTQPPPIEYAVAQTTPSINSLVDDGEQPKVSSTDSVKNISNSPLP